MGVKDWLFWEDKIDTKAIALNMLMNHPDFQSGRYTLAWEKDPNNPKEFLPMIRKARPRVMFSGEEKKETTILE